jgi:hypothetical protein
MGGFIKTPEQRELEILKNRLEKLEKRCDNFHARLDNLEDPDSLGSSVPPGSESARSSSSDKPPLTSRADPEIPERGKIRVFGEFRLMPLSGSTHLCHSGEILDCRIERRIPGDTDTYRDFAYFRNGSDAALVISVLASSQPSGGFNQPAGGPPTPDLAAQPDSNKKNSDSLGSSVPPGSDSALRGETQEDRDLAGYEDQLAKGWIEGNLDVHERLSEAAERSHTPAGGPRTPDLAAQPDSTPKFDTGDFDEPAYQAINRLERYRIGVHDYASFVSCLRDNFKLIFGEDQPLTDPQDMIQRMTAEIQGLRRLGSLDLKGGSVQGDGNDARSSATEDKTDAQL